jgi:histidinol-phosphate/aromatic aminotransferase/cobyric acid decarboxylase-like protein
MIKIKNLRYEKLKNPWDVKVDRSSTLGNPFILNAKRDRESACSNYDKYFKVRVKSYSAENKRFYDELDRLKELYKLYNKLNLFCWCSPKQCHAETIKTYLKGEEK